MTLAGLATLLVASAAANAEPQPRVMVVPFVMQPASAAWVGEYLADDMPRTLALAGVAAVPRPMRTAAHDAFGLAQAPLSRATAIRMAEALAADRVVIGSGTFDASGVTLEARILDVSRGSLSAPLRASGSLETLTDVAFSLAWDVALAGSPGPARTRVETARERVRRHYTVLRAYGEALVTGDSARRLKMLAEAVSLAPDFDAARLDLVRARLDARDFAAALEEVRRMAAGAPAATRREADFLQGAALFGLGRFDEADALYQRLSAANETAPVLANRALAVLRSPRPAALRAGAARASDLLRQANALLPGSTEVTFDLGFALFVEGDDDAAIFWLRGLQELDPEDNDARMVLAWALRRAGRTAEADAAWQALVKRSRSLAGMAAPDPARRLERVLSTENPFVLDPNRRGDSADAAGLRDHGERALLAGDLDTAFRELSRAAYLNPYEASVHRSLAQVHVRRGDRENAAAELRTSLWCAESTAVRVELMNLFAELGRRAEAESEARRILKADPGNEAARKLAPNGSL